MQLIIDNKVIVAPIASILTKLKIESNSHYLRDIKDMGKEVRVTCPHHKGGQESNPSCYVCARTDLEIEYGTYHCFTCGESGPLYKIVATCLHISNKDAKQWLVDNFGDTFVEERLTLEDIQLTPQKKTYLNPEILTKYDYYHPYMWHRGLTKEVVDVFHIGFDKELNAITFPVWDIKNNLVMITARCVDRKRFHIDKEVDKPVYLLNFINQWHIDKVIVCESQINALYCWSMGYPAIALIGTGSVEQYKILNRSGIRSYILAFDGDEAGEKGRERFLQHIRKDVFITCKKLPKNKDVNDLSKEEFDKLENISII